MKKKGKKEKKARKSKALNEFETVNYEQQILENNRQLARLRSRNEELEVEAESLKEKLAQLEENKADLTSHLERVLQKKVEEAQELQERLTALEKLRKEEQQAFDKREQTLEQEFKTMEKNLSAEIKLAAGKLSVLEDWRLARIDLMNKFEDQEKRMAEQEARHKETLYETEKKLIIGKAQMQRELEKRLTELSERFREATSLRLADATQRAVRENAALHRELNSLLRHCRQLDSQVEDYKERERTLRLQASLSETEAQLALEKVLKQSQAIEHLASEHDRMSRAIGRALRAEGVAARGRRALEEAQRGRAEARDKTRVLEQNVQVTRDTRIASGREARDQCRQLGRLAGILAEVERVVVEALQVKSEILKDAEEEEDAGSSSILDIKEKLLHSLLDILASYQVSTIEETTEYESEPVENLYEFGNLGLIPTYSQENVSNTDQSDVLSEDPKDEKAASLQDSLTIPDCSCD
ncbi:golgin subfamily A member 4-like [Phymastichus coffea]|uniref:golgin subfamily A member 4-like n=1 Tax=Phymastichus coffea TaxID=108790 RepID=UPI00273B0D5E|nr:golgin subfamily A member 4-like [Phymastichus coffea]